MPKGRNAGYIFGILHPETREIVFIGNSFQPWVSIKRHIYGGGHPDLTEWLRELIQGREVEILEDVMIEKFENSRIKLPEPKENCVRIDWKVLDIEPITEESSNTLKRAVIKEYKMRGEAYFNKTPGRPKGYTRHIIAVLKEERAARKAEEERRIMETLT